MYFLLILRWTIICAGLALLLSLVLPGCTLLQPSIDRTAQYVTRYCEEVPAAARLEARAAINRAAAPHSVRIDCAGDPGAP